MIAAAVWLAEQGAYVGWGSASDGKAVRRTWKSDMTRDPGQIRAMLTEGRNSLIVPAGRLVVLDFDRADAHEQAVAAGLPPTFTIETPSRRIDAEGQPYIGRHVYALVPDGFDVTTLPGAFAGGEIRRSVDGEQSMVLGPWSERDDGVYAPAPGTPRTLGELLATVTDWLIANRAASSRPPASRDDWRWDESMGSRHEHLLAQIRFWRGKGVVGDALRELVRRYIDEHEIPLTMGGRTIDDDEIERMCVGAEQKFGADRPSMAGLTPAGVATYLEPEDRGAATASPTAGVEYVADLIRPGRIHVVVGEEGVGKSLSAGGAGELGLRLAVAGGQFAGTWPINVTGPVLYLSEMHSDEDLAREAEIGTALGLDRAALGGRLFRLPVDDAAGPSALPLDSDEWPAWMGEWCAEHGIIALIFDTGTAATASEPWGASFRAVVRRLRVILARSPGTAVIVLVHFRKPDRRSHSAARGMADVMGEWGRPTDVVILMERESPGRVRITVRKRTTERTIVVRQQAGLLVEPEDMTGVRPGRKVSRAGVVAAVIDSPGVSVRELADRLDVAPDTAARYADDAEAAGLVRSVREVGRKGGAQRLRRRLFPALETAPDDKDAPVGGSDGHRTDAGQMSDGPSDGSTIPNRPSVRPLYRSDGGSSDGSGSLNIDPASMWAAIDDTGGIKGGRPDA